MLKEDTNIWLVHLHHIQRTIRGTREKWFRQRYLGSSPDVDRRPQPQASIYYTRQWGCHTCIATLRRSEAPPSPVRISWSSPRAACKYYYVRWMSARLLQHAALATSHGLHAKLALMISAKHARPHVGSTRTRH